MTQDRNCLTYWFQRLLDAGVPVPKTEIVCAGEDWHTMLGVFDNPQQHPESSANAIALVERVQSDVIRAAHKIGGFPAFMRTGQGSGKHNWKSCCYVPDAESVGEHIVALIEWSECVDFMGLDWQFWCVRELLPVEPITTLPAYGDFPLVREVRAFIRDGKVQCVHPYWPADSIREGFGMRFTGPKSDDHVLNLIEDKGPKTWKPGRYPIPKDLDRIIVEGSCLPKYLAGWAELLDRVATAFAGDGAWSVDILETSRGWHVTDMAEAHRSFHWPDCKEVKI